MNEGIFLLLGSFCVLKIFGMIDQLFSFLYDEEEYEREGFGSFRMGEKHKGFR